MAEESSAAGNNNRKKKTASFNDELRSASPDEYFKANKPGSHLNSGQQQIILNVYAWLRKTNPPMMPTDAAIRASEMCGVSVASVRKARKTIREGKQLKTPSGKRTFLVKKVPSNTILDDFNKSSVRRKVHECFFKKENVTLRSLKEKLDADPTFPTMSRSTLHNCLKAVGFSYEKKGQNRVMIEREEIIFLRRNYLRQIRQYRQQGKSIVYLDETWLISGKNLSKAHKTARQSFIEGLIMGSNIPPGNGGRSIILQSGRKEGYITGVQLAFLAKRSDYNGHVTDRDHFQKWVEEELLPNFPEKSVIVMDNASCHSSPTEPLPERTAKKTVIREWLTRKNIPWTLDMSKSTLHELLLANREYAKHYVIDHLLQEGGHDVLRLPPFHSELNPIELAWGKIKNEVSISTVTVKVKDMQDKLVIAIGALTSEDWENFVDQVMKAEESFWLADCLQGEHETLGIGLDDFECAEETYEEMEI